MRAASWKKKTKNTLGRLCIVSFLIWTFEAVTGMHPPLAPAPALLPPPQWGGAEHCDTDWPLHRRRHAKTYQALCAVNIIYSVFSFSCGWLSAETLQSAIITIMTLQQCCYHKFTSLSRDVTEPAELLLQLQNKHLGSIWGWKCTLVLNSLRNEGCGSQTHTCTSTWTHVPGEFYPQIFHLYWEFVKHS